MAQNRCFLNVKGYKIDFTTNTIVMNFKFAEAASKFGTIENELIREIRKELPGMREVVRSGRKKTTTRPNKRLTYKNMEQYIQAHGNAAELMDVFETVKMLSAPLASPYKYVCDWFHTQFPNYKDVPMFESGNLVVLPVAAPNTMAYPHKLDDAA